MRWIAVAGKIAARRDKRIQECLQSVSIGDGLKHRINLANRWALPVIVTLGSSTNGDWRMAYHSLKSSFFVDSQGVVTPKARSVPRHLALKIYERDGGRCKKCGVRCRFGGNSVSPFDRIKSSACDHIFPRSRGGQNDEANLQLLCLSCNAQKGAK